MQGDPEPGRGMLKHITCMEKNKKKQSPCFQLRSGYCPQSCPSPEQGAGRDGARMQLEQRDAQHSWSLPRPHVNPETTPPPVPTPGKKPEPKPCCRGTQLSAERWKAPEVLGPEQKHGPEAAAGAAQTLLGSARKDKSFASPGPASSPPPPSAPVPQPNLAGMAPAALPFCRSHNKPFGSPASLPRPSSEGSNQELQAAAGKRPAIYSTGKTAQEPTHGMGEEPLNHELIIPTWCPANEISNRHQPL